MSDSGDSVTGTTAEQAKVLAKNAQYLIADGGARPLGAQQPAVAVPGDRAGGRAMVDRSKPPTDPIGREMLISCAAALYGLLLAVRSLGYQP